MQPSSNGSVLAIPPEWNGTEVPFPREHTVLDFFQKQVEAQPESVAVKDLQSSMTYRELDSKSNRVANELKARGLKPEEAVMILLPKCGELLAAVVGVLKAGGTYFQMDVEIPVKRLELLIEDSKSRFILSDANGLELLRESKGKVLDVAAIFRDDNAETDKDFVAVSDPNRRAYINYTSGSTGLPKGVEIEHHSLTNLVCYYHQRLNLSRSDRASMLAYVAFDASIADVWPVLCAGGSVVIPPKGLLLNPDRLIAWLAAEEITLTFVPTGLAEILFGRPWPEQTKLRFLITGGDRLRVRPPPGLPFVVLNGYGPTENTVFSTWSVVSPLNGDVQPPPIGRPIGNTTAYVLNEDLQPVSMSEAGELYVGGEQVARGYVGRSEWTRERFLPDPFVSKPGARMYRTGDWVRWLPDGELDFLGRKDGQIQIRGRRVELGEIEAVLFAHGGVRRVCCVPWLDDGMPCGVIAHIVPESQSAGLPETLREYLEARLPNYMVPSKFILHEDLPLTPQGKLDREALIKLQPAAQKSFPAALHADGLEQALARLWHSLLPAAESSPPETTFLDLGGDSLLLMKLMLGVGEIINLPLEGSTFLMKPTFAGLCEAVKMRLTETEFQPVLTFRKSGTRPPLFFLYGHNGDVQFYFDLVEALGNDQPAYGIRSPALQDLNRLPHSIEQAATEALGWIRKVQPEGSLALVGYSWASLVAFEIARQIVRSEGIYSFAALIGPEAPSRRANFASRAAHFLRFFPPWFWQLIRDNTNRKQRFKRCLAMAFALPVDNPPLEDWAANPVSRHMISLMGKYQPFPKSDVTVDLFREQDDYQPNAHPSEAHRTAHLLDCGWSFWTCEQIRVNWVEGTHWTMLKPPAVSGLAKSIRQAMDKQFDRISSKTKVASKR